MKVLIFKRKIIGVVLLLLLCVTSLAVSIDGKPFASVYFGDTLKKYPIYSVATEEKKIAISFDAAWGADKTLDILEVLDEFNVKATFFLVGIWIEKYPELTKEIADRGFEIGSHSYNHPDFTKLDKIHMKAELESTNELLEEVTGIRPTLFRPPFGAYNDTLIETLEELNMKGIQWDVDTLDWKGYTPSQVLNRVTSKVGSGSIILCHNNADYVVDSTRLILSTLLNKGYQFVTIGELTKDVKEVKIGVGQL
ncbi:MAG: polysaccharide deacetylase family protein [Clostridia bacterium]|nr:polysaccharide deacetylase family protein [Clostridia bacterium]